MIVKNWKQDVAVELETQELMGIVMPIDNPKVILCSRLVQHKQDRNLTDLDLRRALGMSHVGLYRFMDPNNLSTKLSTLVKVAAYLNLQILVKEKE